MNRYCQIAIAGALSLGLVATASADAVLLRDGLLADDQVLYVMKPAGGIEALEALTGRAVWDSAEADRPLMVKDGRLLAQRATGQRGKLELQFLDTASGASEASRTVALPGDVLASVDDRLESRFSVSPLTAAATDLVWRYEHRPAQGVLDVGSGAPLTRRAGTLRAGFESLTVGAVARAAPDRPVFDRVARVDFAANGERAFYSEDRRHVLLSRRVDGTLEYRWRLYEEGGAQLGQWRSTVSFTPFVVRAGRALFVSTPGVQQKGETVAVWPLQLTAVDVSSGDIVWTRQVRDTRYTGPVAP